MSFSGLKKSFSQKKQRTSDEINQDYSNHAIQLGHKTRIIRQYQKEVEEHARRMTEINQEALDLPKSPPPEVSTQTPERLSNEQEHG